MTAISPREPFAVAKQEARLAAPTKVVRVGDTAMVLGAVSLVGGVLIDLAGGLLMASGPTIHHIVGGLQAPLITLGQVFLVGGAVASRLGRRRAARDAARLPGESPTK